MPLTSFSEPLGKGRGFQWFAPADDSPIFFAGIETREWTSVRKVKDGETVKVSAGVDSLTINGIQAEAA